MKMRQRGRHLIAYGMSPTVVRWDFKTNRPTWQTRHPLEAMPSTDLLPGQITPQDCMFVYRRSAGWMRASGYANQLLQLTQDYDTPQDASILMIEYLDSAHTTLMAAGYHSPDPYLPVSMMNADGSVLKGVILEQYPNPIGLTPVSMPMRVTLDGAQGQFDNMIGMYYQQAKLMALEVIAVEKGIFLTLIWLVVQVRLGVSLTDPTMVVAEWSMLSLEETSARFNRNLGISLIPQSTGWNEINGLLLEYQPSSEESPVATFARGVEVTLFFPLSLTTPSQKHRKHSLTH